MAQTPNKSWQQEFVDGVTVAPHDKGKFNKVYNMAEDLPQWIGKEGPGLDVGTNTYMVNMAQAAVDHASDNDLLGSKEWEDVAASVQYFIAESIKRTEGGQEAAKLIEATAANRDDPKETIQLMSQLAQFYLGTDDETFGNLVGSLKTGDINIGVSAMHEFARKAGQGIASSELSYHVRKAAVDKPHAWAGYAFQKMGDDFGYIPEDMETLYSNSLVQPAAAINRHGQLRERFKPQSLDDLVQYH